VRALRAALHRTGEWRIAVVALVLGVAFVGGYDFALGSSRYPFSGDSASYIEMAASLRATGRPRVTPWTVEPADQDAVPQPLFPPGFAVLVAALTPLAGSARSASQLPSRIAAALLPLLMLVFWRGAAAPAALLGVGAWALLSPGVREWQFVAYSDVTALACAVVALGALARALTAPASLRAQAAWCVGAGLAAATCYALRNAGLAVLAASAATLGYARLRGFIGPRPIGFWLLGTAAPLIMLESYNFATFGTLWPYSMPPSVRGWPLNLVDFAGAQLGDAGLPDSLAAALPGALLVAVVGIVLALGVAAAWATRAERRPHLLLMLLGLYAGVGAALLVASRSRYEWGNFIDARNVLQYTFAFGLAATVAASALLSARVRRLAALAAVLLIGVRGIDAGLEAEATRHAAPEPWLELNRDARVIAAMREIADGTLVASNAAVLFRIAGPRAVRQLDVGGDDSDFRGSLATLTEAGGQRPTAFMLVCNEWTGQLSACRGRESTAGPACTVVRSAAPIVAQCDTDVGHANDPLRASPTPVRT
jgi:hypothetical protein